MEAALADEVRESVTITSNDVKKLKRKLKSVPTPPAEPPAAKADTDAGGGDAAIVPAAGAKQLVAFIERVESVERDMAEQSEDRKQIYNEARSAGFDVPTMKKIVALRKMDESDRLEAQALLDTYMHACGLAVQIEMKV